MRKTNLLQLHNVGIVVDDLRAAIAFFADIPAASILFLVRCCD